MEKTRSILSAGRNQINQENEVELLIVLDKEQLWSLEERIKKAPKLLNSSAAEKSCSIIRVPQNIMELHPRSFQPGIVSIGPYYHGKERLQMMEEHKTRILGVFLNEVKDHVVLDQLLNAIKEKEEQIRGCYSQNIDEYNSYKLTEMMVVDGCFIIKLLCAVGKIAIAHSNDPIFNFPWMMSSLTRDLLLLENQIPFFVLQTLYHISLADYHELPSLQELILTLINYSLPRCREASNLCDKYKGFCGEHILDFYRSTYIPSSGTEIDELRDLSVWSFSKEDTADDIVSVLSLSSNQETADQVDLPVDHAYEEEISRDVVEGADDIVSSLSLSSNKESTGLEDLPVNHVVEDTWPGGGIQLMKKWVKKFGVLVGIQFKEKVDYTDESLLRFIQPVETLLRAGIKFKKREDTDSFLDIDFNRGALRIPHLVTGEIMRCLILNCIVFEQCYWHRSKHFISYLNFMGHLINTTSDAACLREKNIIQNFAGTDEQLVKFFNDVGENIPYYSDQDYLMKVTEKVEVYYRKARHVGWAEFKHKYFGSVWIGLSASAALLVVLLTILQTFYTVYGYYNSN